MTPELLRRAMPYAGARVDVFAGPLTAAMEKWGITTLARQAAFLANVAVETRSLQALVEDLDYSADRLVTIWPSHFPTIQSAEAYAHRPELIANVVYANRNGNGPPAGGDGWHFRGRGLPMLTGHENYAACGRALGLSLLVSPQLLEQPDGASQAGAWFWQSRGLNELADRDPNEFASICHRWNGGYVDIDQRIGCWVVARKALGL